MRAFVGFAGFGLVDIALREAGYQTVSVEIDPAVAEVNRANGGKVITADILTLDPADFVGYDLAHFSPPCPNFSQAKAGGEETELDRALARWIARFVVVVQPEYFTLENVWAYRVSESWAIILQALTGTGYAVDWWHLNAADYGVPQTRKRMIAIARLDGLNPTRPSPTHRNPAKDQPGQTAMFEPLPAWVGWYEAIVDLIPGLPASKFAPWQKGRFPEELKTFMIPGDNSGNGVVRASDQPMVTIQTRPPERCTHRAFILGQGDRSTPKTSESPSDTITANGNQTGIKAVIVDCQNNGPPDKRTLTIRQEDDPIFTMTASANRPTIRAGLRSGRVVAMTPRALARFQGFPDWFVLPDEPGLSDNPTLVFDRFFNKRSPRSLACYGIGNALPSGLYRAALKSLGEDCQ